MPNNTTACNVINNTNVPIITEQNYNTNNNNGSRKPTNVLGCSPAFVYRTAMPFAHG
jgi:hypothetical protein